MREAADVQEYERAARLRDRLASVRKAIEKQTIVTEKPEDLDVIGMSGDELEMAVQVFFVRRGRVVGRKGFILDLVEDVSPGELVGRVLEGLYAEAEPQAIPHQVLVPDEPADADVYREFLCEVRGSNVSIRVPQRGDKRALQATVTQNAKEEFVRHRLRRASDHNARARALTALQDALGLPDAPLRIECFDMSHIQGSDYVGSMVVMEDGLPKKSDYRRFRIKEVPGNDDFAAMEEVLTRRLTALIVERDRSLGDAGRGRGSSPTRRTCWWSTAARGQLNVAQRVVESLGLEEEIAVAGLAKRFEEVFVPGQADPIRIPRQSEALYMLQRLRDEAHRFAITYHRELRGKRMTTSVLDGIKGLGETRRKRLVKELGGIKAVKEASLERAAGPEMAPRRRRPGRLREGPRATGDDVGRPGPVQVSPVRRGRRTKGDRRQPVGGARPVVAGRLHRRRRRRVHRADPPDGGGPPGGRGRRARRGDGGGPDRPGGGRRRGRPTGGRRRLRPGPARRRRPAGGRPGLRRAVAGALPFPSESFDAVVACLVFEHIDDAVGAIDEVARVLRPGGRFLYFLNHPLLQAPGSGWIDDHILEEQYWRIGPYLVEETSLEEVEKDVFLPFVHRPLSRYVNALADAGLVIRRMEEPPPPPGFLERAQEYRDAATIPRLLFLRAEKLVSDE